MLSHKRLFIGLCLIVWFINTCMTGRFSLPGVWMGLSASLITVPVWTFIGSVLSGVCLFLCRVARVDVAKGLSLWQKADVGLALAVVLKPALGIPL